MIEGFTVTFAGIMQAGAGGIVAIGVLMMFTGRIVSRKVHEERVQDAKDTATLWRAAHESSETARRENESLVRENLETSRAVLHLMHSLRSAAFREDEANAATTQDT